MNEEFATDELHQNTVKSPDIMEKLISAMEGMLQMSEAQARSISAIAEVLIEIKISLARIEGKLNAANENNAANYERIDGEMKKFIMAMHDETESHEAIYVKLNEIRGLVAKSLENSKDDAKQKDLDAKLDVIISMLQKAKSITRARPKAKAKPRAKTKPRKRAARRTGPRGAVVDYSAIEDMIVGYLRDTGRLPYQPLLLHTKLNDATLQKILSKLVSENRIGINEEDGGVFYYAK